MKLAISMMHANLMRIFSMKIGGESPTRSQRSNFRILEISFHFEMNQKTMISILELIGNGTIFRIVEVSVPFRDEFPGRI